MAYLTSCSSSTSVGTDLEKIADDAVVGHLEDRRFLVLVDGDDDAAVLHAGEVLDGARDADGDVEVRRDDLAGLADLPVVRHEARVDRGARGAHRRAELVGERLEHLGEVLAEPMPRPPETMIFAAVSSGRSTSRPRGLRTKTNPNQAVRSPVPRMQPRSREKQRRTRSCGP
jgi:hypothetical protein